VKPLMSSSGKGQSVVRTEADIEKSWNYAMSGTRGDLMEVIVEEFIKFESEITLLTITQKNGPTLFCPPIGHRQERGDYQESWMPHPMTNAHLNEAEQMADKVTRALSGYGIWGVEFFLAENGVYFSELSPRPHDTGMVTLANTLPLNEFELHLRAVLGLPIPDLSLQKAGASAVVLANKEGVPNISGIEQALNEPLVDVKIFGKPVTRPYRRMAVALAWDKPGTDVKSLVAKAQSVAAKVKVH
jgi:phosphoribosylglycinamide formyltransferase 2